MAVIEAVVVPTLNNETESEFINDLSSRYNQDIFAIDNELIEGGICHKYNHAIRWLLSDADIEVRDDSWMIFQHNDAYPISRVEDIEKKLDLAREKGASVVGVAGSWAVPPVSPGFWWHGLGTPQFRGAGVVQHPMRDMTRPDEMAVTDQFIFNFYGPYPKRVAAIDGLWLAVNVFDLKKYSELRFDQDTFDSDYHYYDADFCATVRRLNLQMWIMGVVMHHESPGISMMQTGFLLAQKKFMKKWWKNQAEYAKYDAV